MYMYPWVCLACMTICIIAFMNQMDFACIHKKFIQTFYVKALRMIFDTSSPQIKIIKISELIFFEKRTSFHLLLANRNTYMVLKYNNTFQVNPLWW